MGTHHLTTTSLNSIPTTTLSTIDIVRIGLTPVPSHPTWRGHEAGHEGFTGILRRTTWSFSFTAGSPTSSNWARWSWKLNRKPAWEEGYLRCMDDRVIYWKSETPLESVCLSLRPSVWLATCLSANFSVYLSNELPTYLCIQLPIRLSM